MTREEKIERALKVMVLTPGIRSWLHQNDPKALEQAERALEIRLATAPLRIMCLGCGTMNNPTAETCSLCGHAGLK